MTAVKRSSRSPAYGVLRRGVLPAVLAVLLASAGTALARASQDRAEPAQNEDLAARYERLVELYRHGRTDEAVLGVLELGQDGLAAISSRWRWAAAEGSGGGAVSSPQRLMLLGMLHTDCAFTLYTRADPRLNAAAVAHLHHAQSLVAGAEPNIRPKGSFRRRWYLAVLMFLGEHYEYRGQWFESALQMYANDPAILLEAAVESERLSFLTATWTQHQSDDGLQAARSLQRRRLMEARSHLERVLEADSSMVEAEVRLARVTGALGETDTARATLGRLVESDLPRDLACVANLLLGGWAEESGDESAALDHYKAAVASWPSSQGARTALAHLLFRSGAREEAVETARGSLAIDFDAGTQDPWLRYRRTQFRSFDELLVGLRQEARQ